MLKQTQVNLGSWVALNARNFERVYFSNALNLFNDQT